MSVLSQVLGGAGEPHTIQYKGKTYQVRPLDQKAKDAFQKRLFASARESAAGLKDLMTPEQYDAHLLKLNDEFLLGEYALESKRGLAYLQTTAGRLAIAAILLNATDYEVMCLLAERGSEVGSLVALTLKESLPQVAVRPSEGDDPNASGPASSI